MKDLDFNVGFWRELEDVFKQITKASSTRGKTHARNRAENDKGLFDKYWEGKHLNKYLYFLVSDNSKYQSDGDQYPRNWKKLDSKLRYAGCGSADVDDSGITELRDAHGQPSIGVKKLRKFFHGFALYHGFDDLPIPRAILHFLEFCLEHNGGVLSAYYEKPDSNDTESIEKAKGRARKELKDIVRDLSEYIHSSSSEDWLSASNEAAIPFVGRKNELRLLKDFVQGRPSKGEFQIWAMVGPSGAGKTRLLNHWVRQIKPEAWAHIKVTPDTGITWDGWSPETQTLISIDYIYGYDEVIASIIARAKKTEFEHPVRLLLLDHATPDTMEELLRDPRWGFENRGGDNFVEREKKYFFKDEPLKLVVPDKNDEENLKKYDEFLAEIMTAVAYKGKAKPSDYIHEPEIQRGLTYLRQTAGARQALFAALVGYAIRREKESKDKVDDYFQFNRRDLIKQYFKGSDRLTWTLKGKDKKMGKWAACFIAAATAVRGASFRSLLQVVPEKVMDVIEDTDKFRKLCNGVVSGNDEFTLKAFEPDILGETFFLMFLENCPVMEKCLPELIVSEKGENNDQNAIEFVAFVTRLARNLSNDDQSSDAIKQSWNQLTDLLASIASSRNASFRWAASAACSIIYLLLEDKKQETRAKSFLDQVTPDDLYQPPASLVQERHIGMALKYHALQEEETKPIPDLLLTLLTDWDDSESRNYTALMLAALADNSNVALALVEKDANLGAQNNEKWTALMLACLYNLREVALALVDKDANLGAQNNSEVTALMIACRYDQREVALALVEKDANLEAQDSEKWTALMFACRHDQREVALALVEKDANLGAQNNNKSTALMFACVCDQPKVALALVEKDANLGAQNDEKRTALMFACRHDQREVALALVEKDANLGAQNNNEVTALMLACLYNQREVALALVEKDANLGAQNDEKWTALMFACCHDQREVALALVKKDVELNIANTIGLTCLMLAVFGNHKNVVRAMLDRNIYTDEVMEYKNLKCTALGIARCLEHHEIVTMLEAVGAPELPPYNSDL